MKTVLVTGATDGIGRETAAELGEFGWRVLVHGRSEAKARHAVEELGKRVPKGAFEPVWGDFARMREVVALARQVQACAPALDVLLNNAGVIEEGRVVTEDGLERTMAINHYAPFLLTHHLLAAVRRAAAGRIIIVSSMVHTSARLAPADLTFATGYSGYAAYATSKLANILFTLALAKRLEGTGVTANCCHPGVISTKLLRRGWGMGGAPVASGARTPVYLATSPDVEQVSGKYFDNRRAVAPSPAARDAALAEALWLATERTLAAFMRGDPGNE
jgi:NAD(P)-dependent dehydrogenase (short-subunit alcohol dehydrogenase family)